jgi:hypothetical protein
MTESAPNGVLEMLDFYFVRLCQHRQEIEALDIQVGSQYETLAA